MLWILDFRGVCFCLTLTLLWIWFYKQFSCDYWQRLSIKSLKPVPFFGNIADFILRRKIYHEVLTDMYKALGDAPFGGVYQMHDPYLLIKDPKLVSSVLIGDFKFFSNRGALLFFSQNPKKKGDVTMNVSLATGARWKMLRQKMSSAFTSFKVEQMYEQVSHCVALLTEFVDKRMDATESMNFDTQYLADKFCVEVTGLCFFGIQCHAFEKDYNEFVAMYEQVFTTNSFNVLRLVFSVLSKRLWHKLKLPDVNKNVSDFFTGMTLDVVSHRRQNREPKNDFLQVVMNMQNSHVNSKFAVPNCGERVPEDEKFNEMDIAANAFGFSFAAFEAVSTALRFCLYELALNENIQQKLRAEILLVKDQYVELNFNSLREMIYLDAMIAEILRKYPPATSVTRRCVQDYVIPETNTRIPAGTKIIVPVWSIHHDWRHYPNPELFDPERFIGDRKYKQSNGIYLPFGDGPRMCFGKTLAEMELKVVISTIVLKYDIKPCNKTDIPLKFRGGSVTLHTPSGLWLNFTKRKTETVSQS